MGGSAQREDGFGEERKERFRRGGGERLVPEIAVHSGESIIEDENFERERKARGEGEESGLGFSIWVLQSSEKFQISKREKIFNLI